jgi:hypothetical protein
MGFRLRIKDEISQMKNPRNTRYSIAIFLVLITTATIFVPKAFALVENPTFLWAQVNQNGFGSTDVIQIFSLEEFKGEIYAGASASDENMPVWKSPDGRTWTKTDGQTPVEVSSKYEIMDLHEHNGYLYAATYSVNPTQLWRTSDGTNWVSITDPDFVNEATRFLFSTATKISYMFPIFATSS